MTGRPPVAVDGDRERAAPPRDGAACSAPRVVILGAGGHGREVLQVVRDHGAAEFLGFLDDVEPAREVLDRLGVCWLGPLPLLADLPADIRYLAGAGAGHVRRDMDRLAGDREPFTVVHPMASVGSDVELAPGVVVFAFATVTTNVRLGRHSHIGRGAAVGHDSVIGNYVSVYPLAAVSGNVHLADGVTVGTTASIRQGQRMAADVFIGSGAAVVSDFPSGVTVVGVPAVVKSERPRSAPPAVEDPGRRQAPPPARRDEHERRAGGGC